MKRLLLGTLAAVALGAATQASAKEKITYAYLIEPAMEGVLYGIKSGIVKSDSIEIEMSSLGIPALIQSTPTRRYDVIMNAVMSIPRAQAKGLQLVVLSTALRSPPGREGGAIWVKADSPYKTVADLKGRKMGNVALRSTGTTWQRIALWKKYGIDVSYKGGDFNWVQMPAPALLGALEAGRVDAAGLIHSQAYKADKSGKYRVVAYTSRDIHDLYGVDVVPAVNVSYPGKLKARPAAFKEFNRIQGVQPDAQGLRRLRGGQSAQGGRGDQQGAKHFAGILRGVAVPLLVLPGDGEQGRRQGLRDRLAGRQGARHPQELSKGRNGDLGTRHKGLGPGAAPARWEARTPRAATCGARRICSPSGS